jgi:hypothetical protein
MAPGKRCPLPAQCRPLHLEDTLLKNVAWFLCAGALFAAAGFAASTTPPTGSGHVLYKWVDKDGVTHYGDRIPPEYASQEQHVINSHGIEIGHLDAQKTPEQLAIDEQKKLDAQQRENRDKNLLSTYSSVQEIERLRDQRLTLLADQIKVTSQFLETLDGRMKKLRADSMRFRPYSADPKAPTMTDQVAEDLVRLTMDMHTQEQNLRQKRSEVSALSIQFESDIDRFKELKHLQ